MVILHLPSGDDKEGRVYWLSMALEIASKQSTRKIVVMGDFNEDMNDQSKVVEILKSKGFLIGELKKTVSKERSSIQ